VKNGKASPTERESVRLRDKSDLVTERNVADLVGRSRILELGASIEKRLMGGGQMHVSNVRGGGWKREVSRPK